jgi:hypothetical protein
MSMAPRRSTQPPPAGGRRRESADIARLVAQGKLDSIGAVTLTPNASTTVVDTDGAYFSTENSAILLSPRSANAAAEIGAGTIYFTPGVRGFTIHHANNAQADRTFGYVVIG